MSNIPAYLEQSTLIPLKQCLDCDTDLEEYDEIRDNGRIVIYLTCPQCNNDYVESYALLRIDQEKDQENVLINSVSIEGNKPF